MPKQHNYNFVGRRGLKIVREVLGGEVDC